MIKNLQIFNFSDVDADTLEKATASKTLHEIKTFEKTTTGFVVWDSCDYLYELTSSLFKARFAVTDKKISAKAVNEAVAKECAKIKATENRDVFKNEQKEYANEIIEAQIAVTLPQTDLTNVYFDFKNSLIFIDSSSENLASLILNTLRQGFGSLSVVPVIHGSQGIHIELQNAIKKDIFGRDIRRGESCDLVGIDKEKIKMRDVRLDSALEFINQGYVVNKLKLLHRSGLLFSVDKRLKITSCQQADAFINTLNDRDYDDRQEHDDAEDLITIAAVNDFINAVKQIKGDL